MNDVTDCLCFGGFTNFSAELGCSPCERYYHRLRYGLGQCVLCAANEYWISTWQACVLCAVDDEDPANEPHSVAVNSEFEDAVWGTGEFDCECNIFCR